MGLSRCFKLEKLNLSFNDLESLPNDCEFPALRKLLLTENRRLQELPMSLARCHQLQVIDVLGTGVLKEMVHQIFEKKEELQQAEMDARLLSERNERLDDDSGLQLLDERARSFAELSDSRKRKRES